MLLPLPLLLLLMMLLMMTMMAVLLVKGARGWLLGVIPVPRGMADSVSGAAAVAAEGGTAAAGDCHSGAVGSEHPVWAGCCMEVVFHCCHCSWVAGLYALGQMQLSLARVWLLHLWAGQAV